MQKIKGFFSDIYIKYTRSEFRKKVEDNPASATIIVTLLIALLPALFGFIQNLETKKTSQKLPNIVQEVYFIENNTIVKIIVIR